MVRRGSTYLFLLNINTENPKEMMRIFCKWFAQSLCLEEMLLCSIDVGYLFYNETKRRSEVRITPELRDRVRKMFAEMHDLYLKRHTPKVKTGPHCERCSLKDICLPKLMNKESVSSYLERRLGFEEIT